MDLAADLVDAWRINARLNLKLLDALTPEQFAAPLTKGKSVPAQFAHIHNVRLMWAKAADPAAAETMTKLGSDELDQASVREALVASAETIANIIESGIAAGKVKNFKPHPSAFVCYFVAHESNHRAQIEIALRQAGIPLAQKLEYGLWEWGTT